MSQLSSVLRDASVERQGSSLQRLPLDASAPYERNTLPAPDPANSPFA